MNEVEAKPVTNTSNAASEEPKTPPKEKKVIGKHSSVAIYPLYFANHQSVSISPNHVLLSFPFDYLCFTRPLFHSIIGSYQSCWHSKVV